VAADSVAAESTAAPFAVAKGPVALRVVPNPCNPRARIAFTLPRAAACRLTLHDLAGRPRTLVARRVPDSSS